MQFNSNVGLKKKCKICGSEYIKTSISRYCSPKCMAENSEKKKPTFKELAKKKKQQETLRALSGGKLGSVPKNQVVSEGLGEFGNNGQFQNVQRGHYDINGMTMYFRSKWEANYALYLNFLIDNKKIKDWDFEPDTFVFDGISFVTRKYTPDFKIKNNDGSIEYHEVKGFMDSKSKTKLKRMKKYHPDVKLILIDSTQYRLISREIGKLCKFY